MERNSTLSDKSSFSLSYELVPGSGVAGRKVDKILDFASQAKKDGRISVLSVTDNAGGSPALAPVAIGSEIQKIGLQPLVHFSLKDKNRAQVESHIYLYQRLGFKQILVMGGDYPGSNWYGQAKPVYDIGPIHTIKLIKLMKKGEYTPLRNDKQMRVDIDCGCVVSPFKITEAEQVWQYVKLLKKIKAGAGFVVTQLGFDLDRYAELLRFLRHRSIDTPLIGNVFIPSPKVAEIMSKGRVPGVHVPIELAEKIKQEDKEWRLLLAADMIAVLKGLGFNGVHIGGSGLSFYDVAFVLDKSEERADNWRDIKARINYKVSGKWFLFTENNQERTLKPGRRPGAVFIQKLFHNLLFSKKNMVSGLFGRFCCFCDRYSWTRNLFTVSEKVIKSILFNCRMCGDCTLAESTYICCQSGCPKKLVNGPCGGSSNGHCEVFPERKCFYIRVYDRLDKNTTLDMLVEKEEIPPKDWALDNTSSWINFFQNRDHTAKKQDPNKDK